ncbi:centrosomal protein of 152 kDa-like isoform X2 [Patiria miniata]|uniref:CEP152 CEP63 binding coiled coil domain-containing protein n=1 Tax=Patiria miniata TaxID=46514 RepID=A0A914A3E2_PATMI|nr:centrosomal protein of 152 kDa-like isoform X2 [Patiria miniata]XP_038058354.1 centrosomal protein of 152 kDa-like isoform X2 [Patiria miniata]XP_038058355.1 centrosomal protein of 152 kDa-like isoform X2 [Patiria miniata]
MNPGTSLQFDGQALEEQQEAELKQEDLQREQELRELLTNALPDDLLDDDTASFSSHESNGSLSDRRGSLPSPSHDPWSHLRHQLPGHHKLIQQQQQQTSTPNEYGNPPPLKTPAPIPYQNGYRGHQGNEQLQNGQQYVESSDDETLGQQYERGEIEGAANDDAHLQRRNSETGHQFPGHTQQGISVHGNQRQMQSNGYAQSNLHGNHLVAHGYQGHGDHGDYLMTNGYRNDGSNHEYANEDPMHENGFERQTLEDGDFEYQDQMYDNQVQQYSPSHRFTQQYSPSRHQVHGDNQHAMQHGRNAQTYARDHRHDNNPSNNNNPAIHRVEYRGDGATATNVHQTEPVQHGMPPSNGFPAVTSQATVGFGQQDAGDLLQKQFLGVGGDEETRQMAQLQILYKARGRELDQLGNQLQVLKEESGRDKRILNHQLALAQGERAGATASYEQCQQLLGESQQENSKLKGQLQAAQVQIQALNAAKHEVEEKLQATESAIESLTSQLSELQRSQPLARAREQQDGLLKSLQERYEQEVTRLKEKVDNGERNLEEKSTDIESLRRELSRVSKAAELAKLEQGNTINTLTSQLQNSQKQCRDLLETGSLQEINLLRVQLQEATAARTFSQDMTSALQEELTEMKEQLQMYESAMELGVMATKSPESIHTSKSFAVRNLAKSDWKTPQSSRSSSDSAPKLSPEDLVQGLRKELERSLQSNRTKRAQVSKLQADLRAARTDLEAGKTRLLGMETTAKDKEVRFKVLEAQLETTKASPTAERATSRRLQDEIDKLRTEKEDMSKTLEALKAEEGRLNEANSDLKKQMVQMVTEWDQDKKIDLERVQKTCLQLHEDSSRHLREELATEFQSERDMLKEAHQHQLQELRSELEQAQKELDAVKGLYIDVCEEKNKIEDTVTKTLRAEASQQLEAAKEAWQAQHDAAVKELRDSLESSHRAELVMAKSGWRQEAEEENKKTVEEQLALAKAEWTEAARKEAGNSALTAADAEWRVKMETELEQRVEQAKKDLETNHQEQLSKQKERLQAEHEGNKAGAVLMAMAKAKTEWMKAAEAEHVMDKAGAIQTAVAKAQTEWIKAAEAGTKEKLKKAIEMAREQWMQEDPEKRLDEAISAARRQWTDEKVDWEKVKEEWMKEKGEEEITKGVAERTKSLESKHLTDITNLQAILEQGRQKMKQEAERDRAAAVEEAKTRMEKEHQRVMEEMLRDAQTKAEKDQSQRLERASNDWQSRLDEEINSRQDAINKALQEAQDQWQKEKQDMLDAQKAALVALTAETEADQEELRSQYEAELERGIEEAVRSARDQWSKNCDTELRKACDEILERKEQIWKQERNDLQEQLSDSAAQLRDHQRQAERHRRKHALARQKLEKEIESLREQLQDADRELKQTEYGLRRELEQLQGRLTGANAAAVEALEAKMAGMQRRYEEELQAARRQRGDGEKMADAETQTVGQNDDSVSSEALQEIKAHYIRTVKKIKVDVMKRMNDMRENCRHTVHSEVMKERHNTAKKLRRYYLECLQKFLEEDQNQTGNGKTKAKSTASKLAAMAKALELPPDQLATKLPQPVASAQGDPSRSQEKDPGPSQSAKSATGKNKSTAVAETVTEDRQHHQPKSDVSQGLPAKVRHPHVSSNKIASYSTSGLRKSANDQAMPSSTPDSSSDRLGSGRSSDEFGPTSLGSSWDEMETGIALSKLPIQPREFNPKPERLASKSHGRTEDNPSLTTSSLSTGSVSARSRDSSPDNSSSGARKVVSNSSSRSVTLKSRESSPDSSPVTAQSTEHSKNQDGFSEPTHRNVTSNSVRNWVTAKSRESSPESSGNGSPGLRFPTKNYSAPSKSSSNITVRSRRNETPSTIGRDGSVSQHSPFKRPITDHKRSAEPRKGPVKVPPPTEKTAAMLATVSAPTLRQVLQVTRHTELPSLGPYKATDISSGSLDTVYNDLPASLGTIQDFPLDNPRDFPLDKVVRFDEPPRGTFAKKSKIELENTRTKLSGVSGSRKFNGASTLPSMSNIGSKKWTLRSTDKLEYLLRQDSGFESPQFEEQIGM